MKLKLVTLSIAMSLALSACGSSSSAAKTACVDAINKSAVAYKKGTGKDMPKDQREMQEKACNAL